ncbi:MAG: hypothetical protein MRZ79_18380 [Bacteroidia bacterium]|nr:hypothetical protein [Bacteroidia bacterium]
MMKLTSALLLILSSVLSSFAQQNQAEILDHLLQFEGRWSLVSSSLILSPAPPDLDTAKFVLNMECTLGKDSMSIHCQFDGSKEILKEVVKSHGQELFVLEPKEQLVYKLSGVRNLSSKQELNASFVTLGKGLFSPNGTLLITEYLVGIEGPVGKHNYEWLQVNLLKESSIYYDEEGKELRKTEWLMKKIP